MQRIVVGTDLQPRSRAAVEVAADLARCSDGTVHLVHAMRPVISTVDPVAAGLDVRSIEEAAMESARADLANLAHDLRNEGVKVEEHIRMGEAAEVLCRVADSVDADLVVVGDRRMKGAGRLLGSVPNRVAHRSERNVLIARTG